MDRLKGPDVVSRADEPLFIFKTGHLEFVLMIASSIGVKEIGAVTIFTRKMADWKAAGYQGDPMVLGKSSE